MDPAPDLCPTCGAYWDCEHKYAKALGRAAAQAREALGDNSQAIAMAAYTADWRELERIAQEAYQKLQETLEPYFDTIRETLEQLKELFLEREPREEDDYQDSTTVVYSLPHNNAPLDVAVRCRSPPTHGRVIKPFNDGDTQLTVGTGALLTTSRGAPTTLKERRCHAYSARLKSRTTRFSATS